MTRVLIVAKKLSLIHDMLWINMQSREYKYDRPVFDQKAKSMTEKYAKVWASGNSSQINQIDTNPIQVLALIDLVLFW